MAYELKEAYSGAQASLYFIYETTFGGRAGSIFDCSSPLSFYEDRRCCKRSCAGWEIGVALILLPIVLG